MTNYNDGKWHGWNGGECPVHPESEIEVIFSNSFGDLMRDFRTASDHLWNPEGMRKADTFAFRVTKDHREPKEYTIDPRKNIIWYSSEDDLVHVKELDK